jgi:hypothetical protein
MTPGMTDRSTCGIRHGTRRFPGPLDPSASIVLARGDDELPGSPYSIIGDAGGLLRLRSDDSLIDERDGGTGFQPVSGEWVTGRMPVPLPGCLPPGRLFPKRPVFC